MNVSIVLVELSQLIVIESENMLSAKRQGHEEGNTTMHLVVRPLPSLL